MTPSPSSSKPSGQAPGDGAPPAGNAAYEDGVLTLSGDWTLPNYRHLEQQLAALGNPARTPGSLSLASLGRIDTAGASLLSEYLGPDALGRLAGEARELADETRRLIQAVADAMARYPASPTPERSRLREALARVGREMEAFGGLLWQLLGFIGLTLATLGSIALRPRRWRVTAFVAAVQDTGLNALPIVALLTFMVGAVVAFLGATILEDFGATIYTVNLVAFSFLREFGVLLAAILLAGRTASSFTAHIGAMKVNEELDALRALGLSPIELLVVPRVLAMMVSLPILTFVGMMAGLLGGALVCVVSLDISVTQFLAIVERDIALRHFLVGLSKAPIFAFLIAVIGCLEGFKVSGSAQSVGEHTTASVVQSIFTVILLDAVGALFFMEMGW
ncbi:MlaE family ABC transporter permease [Marinobacter sp. C2H3]|uniref:MlaE family ABC transporter permease n=1 Tax=Marinobacter sp. C2H3 TaxID=3119003 RepID=UPI003FA5F018